MGRRGGANRAPKAAAAASGSNNPISLREELTGKKQTKGGGVAVNAKAALKVEHLQRLALWAGAEASVPSLGAFFGRGLASAQEALGVPPDPSVFSCQRCETILQPGFNCTVRIEKNRARRRSKKPTSSSQNNVVFTCHFCSNRNLKRGTPTGHMKAICPPKTRSTYKLKPAKSISKKSVNSKKSIGVEEEVREANEIASSEIAEETQTVKTLVCEDESGNAKEMASLEIAREVPTVDSLAGEDEVINAGEVASSAIDGEVPNVDIPATPVAKIGTPLLLVGKRRKRNNPASKKPADPENDPNPTDAETTASMSKKRRRKSWTSLKEISQSSDHNKIRNMDHLTVPFFIK